MRPKQGIEPCQKQIQAKRKTKLHSTRPRKNGYSQLRQQKSRRKESLWWIPELVCIWSARETLTLLSWRPWGHQGVRRWWRPTARCKQKKTPRYVNQLDLFVTFSHSANSAKIMGSYHWTSGQKTTSHQKWQEDWLQKNKLCAIRSPWLIEEILYNAHNLLLHHLHVRILYSTATDTPKILYPKEVEVRVRSHGETRRTNQQKTGNTNKIEGPEEIQSDLSHNLPDWLQEFREKLVDESSPSEPLGNPTPKDQDTFPVLVINYQWSREQKWTPVRVSILSTRTFRRTQIAIPAWRQK